MFQKNKIGFYLLLLLPMFGIGQTMTPTSYIDKKSDPIITLGDFSEENLVIENEEAINVFLKHLHSLYHEQKDKVRIVHIGDSHIQAGFFPDATRKSLQNIFGNAGLGFIFPHRLAHTNGISGLSFTSSVPWESKRNIFENHTDLVGLSGFSFYTQYQDFAIAIEVNEDDYAFDSVKIITPDKFSGFNVARAIKEMNLKSYSIKPIQHIIKSGEALSIIARKYGVSIADIKKENNLKSDVIRAGATLSIPVKIEVPEPIDRTAFEIFTSLENSNTYSFPDLQKSLWLLPEKQSETYALNGLILERSASGLIYNGIGVNGARFKDYNRTPLFFEQLDELKPNILIVSLGTNEAFDTMEVGDYIADLKLFIQKVRKNLPEIPMLITTPPPSLVKKSSPNIFVEKYAKEILKLARQEHIAVWDLYHVLGGNENIHNNYTKGWIAKDYIHYTKEGYKKTGELLSETLLKSFSNFIVNSTNE